MVQQNSLKLYSFKLGMDYSNAVQSQKAVTAYL